MDLNCRRLSEIATDVAVKSGLYPDEIVRFARDEIKSTHPPSRRISSTSVDFIGVCRFIPPVRVDLVEKTSSCDEAFSGGP